MFQAFWGASEYPGVSNRGTKRATLYLKAIWPPWPQAPGPSPCFKPFGEPWGTPACPIGTKNEIPYFRAILKAWPQTPGWPCGC